MSRLITVDPDLVVIDGVIYRLHANEIRPIAETPLLLEPRNLQFYLCAACGAVIQPLARMYCGPRCKDHYHSLVAKGAVPP
jgi:hypothetical protein